MPDFMVAKIRWEWIWRSVRKDQRADRVEESACDEQCDGSHSKLSINGTDQKDDDPAHEQKAGIRHQDRDPRKENGFECNEKYGQTPNDAK